VSTSLTGYILLCSCSMLGQKANERTRKGNQFSIGPTRARGHLRTCHTHRTGPLAALVACACTRQAAIATTVSHSSCFSLQEISRRQLATRGHGFSRRRRNRAGSRRHRRGAREPRAPPAVPEPGPRAPDAPVRQAPGAARPAAHAGRHPLHPRHLHARRRCAAGWCGPHRRGRACQHIPTSVI
jgi:hypothetical protein